MSRRKLPQPGAGPQRRRKGPLTVADRLENLRRLTWAAQHPGERVFLIRGDEDPADDPDPDDDDQEQQP